MSGPNTLNPWGTTTVTKQLTGNGTTLLFDKASLNYTDWGYKVSIASGERAQFDGVLDFVDENSNKLSIANIEGVVGAFLRAYDYPGVGPGKNHSVYARVQGSTVCDISLDVQGHQEPG